MRIEPWRPLVLLALALACSAGLAAHAQEAEPPADPTTSGALYDELAAMDTRLFEAAFVKCDLEAVNALVTEDIEFYHDRTGFHVGEQVREDFRALTDSCPAARGIQRRLVEGSLAVYPIHDYGAVQTGLHRFVPSDGSPGSVARFVHLWQSAGGAWKLARVLSFDHRPIESAGAGGSRRR